MRGRVRARAAVLALAVAAVGGFTACGDKDFPQFYSDTQPPPVGKTKTFSDERTLTYSAFVARPKQIYTSPSERGRRVGRLHMTTETGRLESYVVLRGHTNKDGQDWVQVRIPGNPNGRTGWVLREALDKLRPTGTLILVDRRAMKLTLYENGRRSWVRPVGIGRPSTPTPAGHYWIRSLIQITKRGSPYWPYALGTSAYSSLPGWPGGGVVAIHGDAKAPGLIPGQPSHGCIRLHNEDVRWLAHHVTVGTPLWIV